MIYFTIYDTTPQRREGTEVVGVLTCHCGAKYPIYENKEIRCGKCHTELMIVDGNLVMRGLHNGKVGWQ
jgi:hypothetical protein